jgi:hypothetical protein
MATRGINYTHASTVLYNAIYSIIPNNNLQDMQDMRFHT